MTVSAVADIDPLKIKAAQEKYKGDYKVYKSGEELIKESDADAVIVATPHFSHPELTMQALASNKHVICEKPAGVYTKQVKEMNDASEKSDRLFTMMFNQRTNPLYIKMHELVADGSVGEIKRVNWLITSWYRSQSYYDSSSWRATWTGEGGGVLFNQCPHQLDLLQWICGMPDKISAFCHFGKWHDIEVEDDVSAYLEFSNGATGVFVTSTADTPGTNRFEIIGTKAKLVCDEKTLEIYKLKTDEREFNSTYKKGFGEPEFEVEKIQNAGDYPRHAGIISNFTQAILGNEKLLINGKEGIKSVRIMDAMLLSTWLKKPIDIPFDDELYYEQLKKRIASSKVKKNANNIILDVHGTYGKA